LISLNVTVYAEHDLSELQVLLDQVPCLSMLAVQIPWGFPTLSFNITSTSIYRPDFLDNYESKYRRFNSEECDTLAESSIRLRIEVLLIHIKNRVDVLVLINPMFNLRLLTFICDDDSTNNDPVNWPRDCLPSTYLIGRSNNDSSQIQIWIDHQ
jgi:hypothetical protein